MTMANAATALNTHEDDIDTFRAAPLTDSAPADRGDVRGSTKPGLAHNTGHRQVAIPAESQ
jgi:hypothetical protein